MMKEWLEYQAAKLVMGRLDANAIKSTVDELMRQDVYLDAFLDVLDATKPRWDEAEPAMLAALAHFGIALPDTDQAMNCLIAHHLGLIASGAEDPLERFGELLADVDANHDLYDRTQKLLGDSHRIDPLIGLYWSQDELREWPESVSCNGQFGEAGLIELKKRMVAEATRWLAARDGVRP
jgi:hypothetical protein